MKADFVENKEIQVFTDEHEIFRVFKDLPDYPVHDRVQYIRKKFIEGSYSWILPDGKPSLACLSEKFFIICLSIKKNLSISIFLIEKSPSWKAWSTKQARTCHYESKMEGISLSKKARLAMMALVKELKSGKATADSLKNTLKQKF